MSNFPKNIQQKNALVQEHQDSLRNLISNYRGKTREIVQKNKEVNIPVLFSKNQDNHITKNNIILNNLKGDILTLRRQIQLGENEFKKKSRTIFILKSIFVLLLLSVIVGVLVKIQTISKNLGLTVVGILASVLVVLILINLVINRFRNANRLTKNDWVSPTEEDIDNNSPFAMENKCKKCTKCTAAPSTTEVPTTEELNVSTTLVPS